MPLHTREGQLTLVEGSIRALRVFVDTRMTLLTCLLAISGNLRTPRSELGARATSRSRLVLDSLCLFCRRFFQQETWPKVLCSAELVTDYQ